MDVGCFFKLGFKTSDKIEFISILGAKVKLKNERYWNETKQSSEISRLEDHLISGGGEGGGGRVRLIIGSISYHR